MQWWGYAKLSSLWQDTGTLLLGICQAVISLAGYRYFYYWGYAKLSYLWQDTGTFIIGDMPSCHLSGRIQVLLLLGKCQAVISLAGYRYLIIGDLPSCHLSGKIQVLSWGSADLSGRIIVYETDGKLPSVTFLANKKAQYAKMPPLRLRIFIFIHYSQRWTSTLANRSNARHHLISEPPHAPSQQMYASKVWETLWPEGQESIHSWLGSQDVTYLSLHPMSLPPRV